VLIFFCQELEKPQLSSRSCETVGFAGRLQPVSLYIWRSRSMTNGQGLNVAHESVSSICRARVYSAGQKKIRFSRWLPLRHGEMTRRSQTVSEMGEFQHQVQASILRILFISPLPIHLWICRSTEKVLIWNSRQMWLGHDCQKFRLFYSGGFEGIYYYCIFPILEGYSYPWFSTAFLYLSPPESCSVSSSSGLYTRYFDRLL